MRMFEKEDGSQIAKKFRKFYYVRAMEEFASMSESWCVTDDPDSFLLKDCKAVGVS